jgi:hypothetical protein
MSFAVISASPPSTPLRTSGGAPSDVDPPNPHAMRAENRTITRISMVCEEINTELEHLIRAGQQTGRIPEGWNDSKIWTCKSSFSIDFKNDGFRVPSTWTETGNQQVIGKTRGGEMQNYPCDAVIKYLEVGGFGDGINLYEQALINVCHNRASVSSKPLYFGESDDSESDDSEFYYDSESDDNSEIEEILKLWKSASDDVKSRFEMFGVIVIGFSELPEVNISVLVGSPDNPRQPGSVGQQIAYQGASHLLQAQ